MSMTRTVCTIRRHSNSSTFTFGFCCYVFNFGKSKFLGQSKIYSQIKNSVRKFDSPKFTIIIMPKTSRKLNFLQVVCVIWITIEISELLNCKLYG